MLLAHGTQKLKGPDDHSAPSLTRVRIVRIAVALFSRSRFWHFIGVLTIRPPVDVTRDSERALTPIMNNRDASVLSTSVSRKPPDMLGVGHGTGGGGVQVASGDDEHSGGHEGEKAGSQCTGPIGGIVVRWFLVADGPIVGRPPDGGRRLPRSARVDFGDPDAPGSVAASWTSRTTY